MKSLKPKDAYAFLRANPQAAFIDCRARAEYQYVGHPPGAQHVSWNDLPDWEINPLFVAQVKAIARTDQPVVLICRAGNRSLAAGQALERAGFTDVSNVLDGFEGPLDERHHRNTIAGWRRDGLPWEQS